jgi:hypothetical protein
MDCIFLTNLQLEDTKIGQKGYVCAFNYINNLFVLF